MRVLLISIFVLFCTAAFAQRANISVDKMKILYQGIENSITVLVENCDCNEIELKSDKLKINPEVKVSNQGCNFRVIPLSKGKIEVDVFSTKEELKNKIKTFWLYSKKLPNPVPEVGRISNGKISKPELLQQLGLLVKLKHFEYAVRFHVEEYTMVLDLKSSNKIIRRIFYNQRFSEECYNLFRQLQVGDEVYFIDIKYTSPEGELQMLNSAVRLKIKEWVIRKYKPK